MIFFSLERFLVLFHDFSHWVSEREKQCLQVWFISQSRGQSPVSWWKLWPFNADEMELNLFCGMSLTELLSCYWVLRVLFIFSLSLWYIFRYTYIHAYAHTHQIFSPMSYLFIFLQCLSKGGLKFWWCLIYYLFFFWDLCFLCP